MTKMPANARRAALQVLSRDRLAEIAAAFDVPVRDRRAHAAHVDAIVGARALDFCDLLRSLKRDELKAICATLGLDDSGREKDALVQRILGQPDLGGGKDAEDDFALTPPKARAKKKESASRSTSSESKSGEPTVDYRHDATRKNNPPAGLIDFDRPPKQPSRTYAYDPHLDPQLQWAGKAEHTSFEVDTVSLHIHERISAQAIIRSVKREDAQKSLFGESDLPESQAIDFYQHDVGWANRLILGDSLLVMNSLLEREQMAGKVQCIYIDPPYGVRFNSNFQAAISRRDVKDGDDGSLTREPEQIQAYRDTWTLGIHSYLTYLRDRLVIARDLLGERGSVFVQISDENVHRVRLVLDEVFGAENFVSLIPFVKTAGLGASGLPTICDYLLWYARYRDGLKYNQIYAPREAGDPGSEQYSWLELAGGDRRRMTAIELENPRVLPAHARPYRIDNLTSGAFRENTTIPYEFENRVFHPGADKCWKTTKDGLDRLAAARRLQAVGNTLGYVRFIDDFPVQPRKALWTDTGTGGFADDKHYVVQTTQKAILRCVLMTTDPGDLVLDPTCGSGTTAFVAEQWGRRWITCDTSRVAMAIARQRILTARYPYYSLRSDRVRDGFVYKSVPHVTLKSIAQNLRLDACKTQEGRQRLIRECADQEVLYDQPEEDKGKVRVSGPFTVEAIPVASMEDPGDVPVPGPDEGVRYGATTPYAATPADRAGEYIAQMVDLLRKSGGVHFKNARSLPLPTLRPARTAHEWIHAESETGLEGDDRLVAVSFGPRHAPVTPKQVLDALQQARPYGMLLFVGFAFDPEALKIIEKGVPRCEMHFVHAAPDILVGDLLKSRKTTKLFTVFGLPDVKLSRQKDGKVTVTLTGVDIYDPVTGDTVHDDGKNVAAWFLDHDYDGRTFCICQAFFPGQKTKNPWEKLQRALKGTIDEDRFEALRGTTSVPFVPGETIAIKVVDDRGNEVVKIVDGKVPA